MSRPIRLGNIDLSFHAVSAAVVQRIFRGSWGHSVESSASPHEEMFRRYGDYLHAHRQHRSAWTWEVELRPWLEKF